MLFEGKVKHHFIVLLAVAAAGLVLATPLQLRFTLGRYQHYGLAVFVLGLGYVIQAVWSWRSLRLWARTGFLATGLYLGGIGMVMYANPWLDARVAIMTTSKVSMRAFIGYTFTILGVPLGLIYLEWLLEDYKIKRKRPRKPD